MRHSLAAHRGDQSRPGDDALLTDLQERGLLEDTLVIWGGEFGRTVYSQGTLTADNYGRDYRLTDVHGEVVPGILA